MCCTSIACTTGSAFGLHSQGSHSQVSAGSDAACCCITQSLVMEKSYAAPEMQSYLGRLNCHYHFFATPETANRIQRANAPQIQSALTSQGVACKRPLKVQPCVETSIWAKTKIESYCVQGWLIAVGLLPHCLVVAYQYSRPFLTQRLSVAARM